MSQKTIVTVTCDLPHKPKDGEVEGTETLTLGLDGGTYEIDACDPHAKELREAFAVYVEHSRRVGAKTARRNRSNASRERSGEIRAWAKGQGITVNDRGRIPATVVEQYDAAN